MIDYQGMVREFMVKHGQYRTACPGVEIPQDVAMLRVRLICEEHGELIAALHERDLVKVADALCDMLYVIYGTGDAYGIPLFPEGYPYNSQWFKTSPTFLSVDKCMSAYAQLSSYVTEVARVLARPTNDIGQFSEIRRRLEDLTSAVFKVAYSFGLPIEELFTEVHRSNMTKGKLGGNQKGGKVGKSSSFEPPQLAQIIMNYASL
jgi:predicted HAD superfamily Cof-like phosphohydrolase